MYICWFLFIWKLESFQGVHKPSLPHSILSYLSSSERKHVFLSHFNWHVLSVPHISQQSAIPLEHIRCGIWHGNLSTPRRRKFHRFACTDTDIDISHAQSHSSFLDYIPVEYSLIRLMFKSVSFHCCRRPFLCLMPYDMQPTSPLAVI